MFPGRTGYRPRWAAHRFADRVRTAGRTVGQTGRAMTTVNSNAPPPVDERGRDLVVSVPGSPPTLTIGAARALLRLLTEADRQLEQAVLPTLSPRA